MIGAVVCFICCPILRMTFFMFCGVPRLVGGYRGEQYTADQGMPVKKHTQVERMTDVKGQSKRLAS